MGFYNDSLLDLDKYKTGNTSDYSSDVDPQRILRDPAFLDDLRTYYRDQGKTFYDDRSLIDAFYTDKTWDDLNTVGAVGSAVEAHTGNKEQRERMKRIEQVWRQMPFFWQEGGRGSKAFGDIATGILADPVNLIPGVAAYKGAASATRGAYLAGKSSPMMRGVLSGTAKAAGTEAAIGAGQEAVVNTAHQVRDIQLGLQDEFSLGKLGVASGTGAAFGVGVGGAIGVPSAIAGARSGMVPVQALEKLGLSREQISALTPEQLDDFYKNLQQSGATGLLPTPRGEDTTETPVPPEQTQTVFNTGEFGDYAQDLDTLEKTFQDVTKKARDQLDREVLDGADNETLDASTEWVAQLASMRQAVQRAKREAKQINELEQSLDLGDEKIAAQMRVRFEAYMRDVRRVLNGAEGLSSEQLIARMEEDGFGLKRKPETETTTETELAEAPEAPVSEEVPVEEGTAPPRTGEQRVEEPTTEEPKAEEPKADKPKPKAKTDEEIVAEAEGEENLPDEAVAAEIEELRSTDPEGYKDFVKNNEIRVYMPTQPDGNWKKEHIKAIEDAVAEAKTPDAIDKISVMVTGIAENLATNPKFKMPRVKRLKVMLGTDKKQPMVSANEPAISVELKGKALSEGFDWRKLAPSKNSKEGRITRGSLVEARKARPKGTDRDAYAVQVEDDIENIVKDMNLGDDPFGSLPRTKENADTILELVGNFSRAEKYGSGERTEDILALLNYELRRAGFYEDVQQMADNIWTTTEMKLIRTHTKQIKGELPDLSDEAARLVAEARVMKERGAQPRSDVRSTQAGIDKKGIYTTAGREETGRIQSLLRRGTPIARGSDYTTTSGYGARANELGREAAALKALERRQEPLQGGKLKKAQAQYKQMIKNGMDEPSAKRISGLARGTEQVSDLVPYTTTGREKVFGNGGLVEVPKGGTAWYDGVTKKAYISRELAMRARGEKPVVTKPDGGQVEADETVQGKIQSLLRRIKEDKDYNGPEKLISDLRRELQQRKGDTPEAKQNLPESSNAKASPPPQSGNKKLIVRSKDNPDDIRIMSAKQVEDGKDIYAIIGQKGGRSSDPANWDVRYAPMDAYPRSLKAKTELFESLAPEEGLMEGQPSAGGLFEAGNATGLGQPLSVEEANALNVNLNQAERVVIFQLLKKNGFPGTVSQTPKEISFLELREFISQVETERWPLSVLEQSKQVNYLKILYEAQRRTAPQGYVMQNMDRKTAVDNIEKVFNKFTSEEITSAKRLISQLGGDPTTAPILKGKLDNMADVDRGTQGQYNKGTNEISVEQMAPHKIQPRAIVLMHEVGHWAYENILTPQDRIDFWESLDKFYDQGGELNRTRVDDHSPKYNGMKFHVEGFGEAEMEGGTNATISPQEFFANQFSMWVAQRHDQVILKDASFWKRVTAFAKAIFDRFYDKNRIDPNMEPFFAKILPEHERKEFAFGVDAVPTKKEGKVIHSRFKMLELIEEDIATAIETDSTDGIINGFQDLQRWILGVAVNNKEIQLSRHIKMGGTGPLLALRRTNGDPEKILTVLNDKFRAMDEIMRGNAMGDFVSIDDRPMARKFLEGGEFEGLTHMKKNPVEVADTLKDFYYNGYLGKWTPSEGIPAKIIRKDRSSTKAALEMAREALSAGYNRVEGHQLLPPDSIPRSVKREEPPVAEDGTVKFSNKKREAVNRAKREEASTTREAVKNAKTSKVKRSKKSEQDAPDVDPTTAQEVKSIPIKKLVRLYRQHKGTDYGNQIGAEIVAKIKAKPSANEEVPITREIHQMSGKELDAKLTEAFYEGDRKTVNMVAWEMTRRKKSSKEMKIPATFQTMIDVLVSREKVDSQGIARDDGIPSSARASVKDMLSQITHRDAEVQTSARNIAYRMINLIEKTQTGDKISTLDMARLGNGDTRMAGDGVFANYKSPDFNNFRKEARRIAAVINRGKGKSDQAMFNLMSMITRSGLLDTNEKDAILQAFKAKHGKDAPQDVADEWFAEAVSAYTREDLRRNAILADDTDIAVRQTFDNTVDKVIEHSAYVLHGQIGSNKIKQRYRRLTFYGDMFQGKKNSPTEAAYGGQIIFNTHSAADAGADMWNASSPSRKANIHNYTKGGFGYDQAAQRPIMFYHGTPYGWAFKRNLESENVVFRHSKIGNNGPGIYLTENPNVAGEVYADRPTTASMSQKIADLDVNDAKKEELLIEYNDLSRLRANISQKRRQYAELEYGMAVDGDMFDFEAYQSELDKLVTAEEYIAEGLAKEGVYIDPYVMPMVIDLKSPADFRLQADYNIDHPMIKAIMGEILTSTDNADRALAYLQDTFGRMDKSGKDTYNDLVKSLEETGLQHRSAQNALTKILERLGYDGITSTHTNTLSYGGAQMDSGLPYGASAFTHTAVVLFKPEQAKHIGAKYFDRNDEQLYSQVDNWEPIEKGLTGDFTRMLMNDEFKSIGDVPVGQFGELVEEGGSNSTISSAVMSMLRKREPSVAEEQAIRKHGVFGFLNRVSTKIRNQGMNWLADKYQEHYPDMQQRFGKKIMPIFNALRSLPDSDGILRGYFRRSTAGFGQEQPKSHGRIARALRRGDGSRSERQLTTEERAIYRDIRLILGSEREEMIAEGFHVGDRGPNYLPQVWDQGKIRKNKDEFIAKMKRYYEVENLSNNREYSDAEAQAFAEGIMLKLLDESEGGVFIPVKGSTKNSTFENVDYSRVIELEKYPDMLNELEPFLESNLESLLVKYLEGSSRRLTSAKRFGVNSHAVSDYMMVAKEGRMGIARLLSKARQFEYDITAMNSEGVRETATLVDTIRMPFENNQGEAVAFADKLLEIGTTSGPAGVRQMLMEIAPMINGEISPVYKKRVDAIVGAIQDFKGKTGQVAYDTGEEYVDNAMRILHKKPMHGTNKTGMRVSRGLRFFNNVSLLGFTTLTSIGDLGLPIIRSGSFKSWAKGLANMTDPDYKQMIKNVGVAMENVVHERMVHMYGAPDNKASHAFFNATLLTPWTDMNRQIAGATGFETLKTMQIKAQRAFKAGVPYSMQSRQYKTAHRFLKNYGLEEFLPGAPKASEMISNQHLDVNTGNDKVRMAIIKFADDAIFQPNPNDIPMWAQTPVGSLVFQLKSFPLMMTRLGGHVIKEANHGNFTPLIYLASIGPAFGAVTLSVKDIIQMRGGEENREPALRKRNILKALGYDKDTHGDEDNFLGWYVESMMVMGGLGLMGDIIHSAVTQADNGAYGQQRMWSTLLGPSFGLGNATMQVGAGITDEKDNSNSKERSAVREMATRIPVLGGNRKFREAVVDATAGEASSGNTGGWKSSMTESW